MDENREIITQALEDFNRSNDASCEEREQSYEDRRFVNIAGAQYEGDWAKVFENRPKLEVNKIHLSTLRIENEYRNNRITVDFSPRKEGMDRLAELCDGLFRADEQDSSGEEAKDNAFKEMIDGGYAAMRLRTEYEDEYDEDNEQQRIQFEPIHDADQTVFWDVDAKKRDKSDAKHCWVLHPMSHQAYKEEFGDDPSTWPKRDFGNDDDFDWANQQRIYIAEYFKVIDKARVTYVYYKNEMLPDEDEKKFDLDKLESSKKKDLEDTGWSEVRRRKVKERRVRKYLMNGKEILEDCGYIAGRHIPVIPFYGQRTIIDGIERWCGHVRFAKDAQRLKNMQLSRLAETAALSPIEKPIFDPQQVRGLEVRWSKDHIENYPYQLAKVMKDADGNVIQAGPVGYTKPPQVAPAMAALLQVTEEDMRDILGSQQQGEDMANNISGVAMDKIMTRLDMQAFIYMSNFAVGLKHCGKVWLSMAKDIYVEEGRMMKTVDKEGRVGSERMMLNNGEGGYDNDLAASGMDVNIEVGPTSATKRQSIVNSTVNLLGVSQDPENRLVLETTALRNLDGEGMGEIREYARKKLLQIGIGEPTDEDIQAAQAAAQQPQEPTPNDQYLLAEAQKAEAEAQKAQADIQLKIAQAQKTAAEAQQIGAPDPNVSMDVAAPAVNDYREEELFLQAQKAARELELKEREIDIKEQEQRLRAEEMRLKEQEQTAKLAEIGFKIMGEQAEAKDAEEGHNAAMEMANQVAEAVKGLQASMDSNASDRQKALEELSKPRTVTRDDQGNITGVE